MTRQNGFEPEVPPLVRRDTASDVDALRAKLRRLRAERRLLDAVVRWAREQANERAHGEIVERLEELDRFRFVELTRG